VAGNRLMGTRSFRIATGRLRAVRLRLNGNLGGLNQQRRFLANAYTAGPNLPASGPKQLLVALARAPKSKVRNHVAWLTRRGRIALTMGCHQPTELCRGVLTLFAADGSRLGRTRYAIPGGRRFYVPIRLRRPVKRALLRHHRMKMRARAVTRVPFGRNRVVTRNFLAKAARK